MWFKNYLNYYILSNGKSFGIKSILKNLLFINFTYHFNNNVFCSIKND